jgi:hypothetical protein
MPQQRKIWWYFSLHWSCWHIVSSNLMPLWSVVYILMSIQSHSLPCFPNVQLHGCMLTYIPSKFLGVPEHSGSSAETGRATQRSITSTTRARATESKSIRPGMWSAVVKLENMRFKVFSHFSGGRWPCFEVLLLMPSLNSTFLLSAMPSIF